MDTRKTHEFVVREWNRSIEKALCDYVRIPNQSPLFDPDWETNGLIDGTYVVSVYCMHCCIEHIYATPDTLVLLPSISSPLPT